MQNVYCRQHFPKFEPEWVSIMNTQDRKAIFYTSGDRSLYIGRLEPDLKWAIPSAILLVSMEGEIELESPACEHAFRSRSFLIPAGSDVIVQAQGNLVFQCYLDSAGMDFVRLQDKMQHLAPIHSNKCLYHNIKHESDIVNHAKLLFDLRPSSEAAFSIVEHWLGSLPVDPNQVADERVIRALSLIKKSYRENLSVETVADDVGLSVPRLSQLFKQSIGVPIRRFRLWYRTLASVAALGQGCSLTEAAVANGFADYPQLCRVLKELVGTKPTTIRDFTEVKVLAGCF
jgi:AraC-like DNA-binding protein